MPALPNAPQALKCKYEGTYLTTKWVNIFYVTYTATTPTDLDLVALASGIRGVWNSTIGTLSTSTTLLTKASLQDVSRNPGAYGEFTTSTTGSGGANGFPANVAFCMSKKVARRYRGGHPRMYLPGVPTTFSVDGRSIVPAQLTGANAAAQAFRSQINALTSASTGLLVLANVSYYWTPVPHQPPVLRATPVVEPVVTCSFENRIDSQRRRTG